MTDLATRIADVKKKAAKATRGPWHVCSDLPSYAIGAGDYRVVQTANQNNYRRFGTSEAWIGIPSDANAVYIAAASPDLIIEMADEIVRLKAQLEKAREALEPFAKLHDEILECCKLYTAPDNDPESWAKACQWDDLRTAARVHAELAEKEKE